MSQEESESVAPVEKVSFVPVPEKQTEDVPKAAVLPSVVAWGDFDLPKKKKKRREVRIQTGRSIQDF